jgi:hypothetical protein
MPGHSRAAPNLQARPRPRKAPHNVHDQRGAEHLSGRYTHIYFVENENETLSLHLAPAHLLLHQLAATPSWIPHVENEEDNIGLIDDFVLHRM